MKQTKLIQSQITVWQKLTVGQDFNFVLVGALLLILLIIFGSGISYLIPLRIILGLVYVMFVPGYCLTVALFPRIDDLTLVQRLGLSVGCSVALVSILAPVLDRLQLGLHLWPILLCELGICGLVMSIALWRRSKLAADLKFLPKISWQPAWIISSIFRRHFRYILVLGAIALVLPAWTLLTRNPNQSMTEFYILGSEGFVGYYSSEVELQHPVRVNLGVISRDERDFSFHFEVWVMDNLNPDKRERVLRSASFTLRPGETYEQNISWHMPWVGVDQRVDLLLFKDQQTEPSRQLRMWINVKD